MGTAEITGTAEIPARFKEFSKFKIQVDYFLNLIRFIGFKGH